MEMPYATRPTYINCPRVWDKIILPHTMGQNRLCFTCNMPVTSRRLVRPAEPVPSEVEGPAPSRAEIRRLNSADRWWPPYTLVLETVRPAAHVNGTSRGPR